MNFFKKKFGLKSQIIFKVILVFIFSWSLLIFLWYKQLNKDFLIQRTKSLAIQESQLENILDNEQHILLWGLDNISKVAFKDRDFSLSGLTESLKLLSYADKVRFFQYYDINGKLELEFNAPNQDILSKDIFEKIIESPKPFFFFKCSDICYLNAIKIANPTKLEYGVFRTAMPIDDILDKFKAISSADLIALKAIVEPLEATNRLNSYEIDSYTTLSANEAAKLLLKDTDASKIQIRQINNEYYITKVLKHKLDANVILFSIENINELYTSLYENLWHFFYASLMFLAVVLSLLYFFLNRSLYRVKDLINIMDLIGKSYFDKASYQLKTYERKNIPSEIDLVFRTTNELIDQIRKKHKDLEYIADYDSLTGLINRRKFNEALTEKCKVLENRFALVAIDLDFFKIINDTLGHSAGDQLLIRIANILKNITEEKGFAGRIGGDEFFLMLPYVDEAEYFDDLSLLKSEINAIKINQYSISNVGISIGVSLFPEHNSSIEQLIIYADAAMYENKRYKKKSFHIYNGKETLLKAERERQYWNTFIKENLQFNTLSVFFQPVFCMESKCVYSYEALVRFHDHETNQVVPPSKVIAYAERSHTIIQIDRKVFEIAVEMASKIQVQPIIMINLSNITTTSLHLGRYLTSVLKRYDYSPERIILEITESSEITNFPQVIDFIRDMRKLGVRFALDDFGAGFSSFFYLKVLKVDYLKIDKKIIEGLLEDDADHHILTAIVVLTRKFNIKTIAEGIENKSILDAVEKYDIDFLQGFYLARPDKDAFHIHPQNRLALNNRIGGK